MKKYNKVFSLFIALGVLLSVCPVVQVHAADTVTLPINVTFHQTEARKGLDIVNDFRTGSEAWAYDDNGNRVDYANLSTLAWDYDLEKTAMQRAAEAAITYAHVRPDGTSCFSAYPSGYSGNGENLAEYEKDASGAITMWKENYGKTASQQGHRLNMLSKSYNCFAMACVEVNGFCWWAQCFGYRNTGSSTAFDAVDGERAVNVNVLTSYITDMTCSNDSIVLTSDNPSAALPQLNLTVSFTTKDFMGRVQKNNISSTPSNVTWTSGNTSIATIDNGSVKYASVGLTSLNTMAYGRNFQVAVISGGREMYRLYNPNSGEHFYTSGAEERDIDVAAGWNYEGVGWIAPESGTPVFRMYNPVAGEHHYTTSQEEADTLVNAGWNLESSNAWCSAPDSGVPVYREYNPNQFAWNHNYTPSSEENKILIDAGWQYEGVAWYAIG